MQPVIWTLFIASVVFMVCLDLGVFHRRSHVLALKEALAWTFAWVVLAVLFNVLVFFLYGENWFGWTDALAQPLTGREAAVEFLAGYVVEKALSVANIFVIAMIFTSFSVPLVGQHRLLFWGIMGAVVLRGIMIALGAAVITRFDWTVHVFGLLLVGSAAKVLVMRHDNIRPERNLLVRLVRRLYPVSSGNDGGRFFTTVDGRKALTPLFLALLLIETSNVMFAVDAVPAIFVITRDPFLVLASNVFALLGLRSLYFAVAGLMDRFLYLKTSLVFLLAYVGVKMILSPHYPIPNPVSLAVIGGILAVGLLASFAAGSDTATLVSPLVDEVEKLAVTSYRQAKRIAVLLLGSTVLLMGVVMLVLPGPGILVILMALAILALEFAWARVWLRRIRDTVGDVRERVAPASVSKPTPVDKPQA